ncbi:acyl-CoA dehydrogenase [Halieaceae bacterium IMCC14734]|uniref:Acyl-CoA dehydrogenase n=1 Tax=Candidatus Litorirhabdus singularis TaxID=2518993 RepID=A0ABT3TFM2_9GAMM|nr:acyl-CoA/acyl-ACP dehydrogenase [Candidatus Litorirhabdus singularis]MCX2981118.1 acyl-CoA dehydrogenase [Candidatus Litorirhabdus singularis]
MAKANNVITFSDEQAMVLQSARDFCADKSPVTAVRALLPGNTGYSDDVWQEMVALGWLGIALPEQYGGSGLGFGSVVPLAESMGRGLLSTPFFSTTLAAQAILRAGESQQKDTWLPRLAEGTTATLALLDNEDWGAPDTTCTATVAGSEITLQGTKWYVPDAAVAQLFVVHASLDGESALVLVERAQLADSALQSQTLIDETKRACKVDFSGVSVSADAVMRGPLAASALRDIHLLGALLVAAEAAGSAAACLDVVVDYLKTRKQFGRLIGSYQGLKHPTVEILTAMDSARCHVYHAASVIGDEALSEDAEVACRMSKAQATDAITFAGDRAIQFHGGMGFTYECDAQLYMRRAQWVQQQFGDAYHHRKRLAALLLD